MKPERKRPPRKPPLPIRLSGKIGLVVAKKVSRFFGPPTVEERFYDALCAWYWGQKEYAALLMEHLIEDEIDNKKEDNDGKAFPETQEASPEGYVEDDTHYAWNGWRFDNGHC